MNGPAAQLRTRKGRTKSPAGKTEYSAGVFRAGSLRYNVIRKQTEEAGKTNKKVLILVLILALAGLCCPSFAEENAEQAAPELQLNPAELFLTKGHGATVTPTVVNAPKGARTQKTEWTSSDPEVAVFNGMVRGVGGGQAIMTCSVLLTDGTTLTADCAVTVTVPVSGIQAVTKSLTVMAGEPLVPEITVLPEDATDRSVVYSSSDEQILAVGEDGRITAVAEGEAFLTAASGADPSKKIRIPVTVTKRLGKTDREITFLGIPWGSDCETCIRLLKEQGVIAEEVQAGFHYTGNAWHWPENDLLFSRISAWRTLPAVFEERQTGAARTSIRLKKTIGGYLPQTATLVYFNTIGEDGQINADETSLTGVCFSFENREEGAGIFCGLLERLEEAYGEFLKYQSADIPRYYPELNEKIKGPMTDAVSYTVQELGDGVYLGEYAICVIHGTNQTGIMLNIDTNETVTLFYGRTDATDLIRALQETATLEPVQMEDAGV